jgi:hypothetical protein
LFAGLFQDCRVKDRVVNFDILIMKQKLTRSTLVASLCLLMLASSALQATPYASHVRVTGTTVTFILNEPADSLTYSINDGPAQVLDGSTKGSKTFNLVSPTDKFAIVAGKNAAVGYTIPTGGTIAPVANGLSQPTAEGGFNLISDDTNPLVRFNSPRGVSVSIHPNATNFGTVYVANSAAGTTTGVVRSLGDGLYAMKADQSDAFGYFDTAQDPDNRFDGIAASANSPFRVYAATNGEVYTADFSDANGNIYRANFDLTSPGGDSQVFAGIGGPTSLPAGQNHGSTTSVHVEGSLADGNLTVYTVDEDLSPGNSLWRYDIGAGLLPFSGVSNKVNQSAVLIPAATSDMQRGKDGKWYLAQNRSAGGQAGIAVLDADGNYLYDSLSASRNLLSDPATNDIMRNVLAMAVSDDQKWLAALINDSDVAVIPLVNGIPDLANRLLVNTGTDIISGRDIAFDAAGNIHYVSSGQGLYRVLAPGGNTVATMTRDAGSYTFAVTTGTTPLELAISRVGDQVQLEWTGGTLQESSTIDGTFTNSATQISPFTFTPSGNMKFFRLTSP